MAANPRAATTPSSPELAVAAAVPALDPGTGGLAPIPLGQLADFIADQASALAAPTAPGANPKTSSVSAQQSVKELEISLDPANLGAVSLTMRLADGKLSIVIGVANASTLAAIENERGAIAERLGSGLQPLADLVIRSQDSSQDSAPSNSRGNNASDLGDPRQANANENSSGARRGDDGLARRRNVAASASRFAPSPGSTSGGGRGALVV